MHSQADSTSQEHHPSSMLLHAWQGLKHSYVVRNITILLFLAMVIAAVATYWTISHSSNPLGPDPKTVLPMVLTVLVLLLSLSVLITWQVTRLWLSRRRGSVGSRLQTRMIVMFSLVSVVPTVIVAGFSMAFFNQGIQSWFDTRVGNALTESVAVAEGYLEEHRNNIRADVLALANELNRYADRLQDSPKQFKRALAAFAGVRKLTEANILRITEPELKDKDITLQYNEERFTIPSDAIYKAMRGEVVVLTNAEDDRVRALVGLTEFTDTYLLVGRPVDSKVLNHMMAAKDSVDEYQRLRADISTLQIQFSVVFIAVAIVLLLATIWVGMIFASELVSPIINLVSATDRVKAGDLDTRVEEGPLDDEMGSLNRAFNRMAAQLQKHREEMVEVNKQIDQRRRLMEAVLSGVTAGVIALDKEQHITLYNRSAEQLLAIRSAGIQGKHINVVFPEVQQVLDKMERSHHRLLQQEISMNRKDQRITFLVRLVREGPEEETEGYIVTFDDITELLTAQRTAAWGDVARRIAHEIKNPLTPIHLSIDRLKQKYGEEISDMETFERYLDTITRHVGTIGNIVDEFVDFARMPAPTLKRENLSDIVREAVFSQELVQDHVDFTLELPDEVVIDADKAQLSQVFTNVLKNAGEALEGVSDGNLHIAIEQGKDIKVVIEDNGPGFPQGLMDRITEPYVTTREKGTGLGLAIVKKIIGDHEGKLLLTNRKDDKGQVLGAAITLSFPKAA